MLLLVLIDNKFSKQVYIMCQYLPFEKFLIKGKIHNTKSDTDKQIVFLICRFSRDKNVKTK